jgi:predicted Rossmann fold nucleotide-binding protein DprA/Smf involved in DNA uptake
MTELVLSADAQATALLVGRFGKGQAKPLSRSDFNRVAQTLHQRGLRPADLFAQVPSDLSVEPDRISGLISRGTALALAVEGWSQLGIRFVSRGDPAYPARFKRLLKGGSAPILFYAGELNLLERSTFGVVGSRDATDAGLEAAQRIGLRAASEGVVIVSGDARGIDRAAMDAALDAGGQVIGILADSLAKSVLSKRYRQAITDGRLLLLSHTEPDAGFTVSQAMERNRYIYTASDAVIVADSDVKGGTWNGALENLKHRWTPAYVRVGEPIREGNIALAREGLIEWSASWFEIGQALASLFGVEMSTAGALPLFAGGEPGRSARVERESSESVAESVVEAASVSTVHAGEDTARIEPAEAAAGKKGVRAEEQHGVTELIADEPCDRDILFDVFLGRLAGALTTWMPTSAVAEHFAIEAKQAEAWLNYAMRYGKVAFHKGRGWEWLG